MSSRHAPRGPIKTREGGADPIQPTDPMRCHARTRQGKQCGSKPIRGGAVCRMHGGGAPQVKAKAADRLRALQYPALDAYEWLITQRDFPSAAFSAARDVMDRTDGKPIEKVSLEHSGGIAISHEIPE